MFHDLRPYLTYQVAIGASSAASSNPVTSGVKHVRLVATVACNVEISKTPTASQTTSMYLAPNWPEYFLVSANNTDKIAVIEATGGSAGVLTITEMTS